MSRPSQRKRFRADDFGKSKDVYVSFKTPAEIDRALASKENVDSVIGALSSLRWQFQHFGTHQANLQQWLELTSAEALLNLWDRLESERAYGQVLFMLISLLRTILRSIHAASDSDNRLARTLLSPERVAKLNVILSGKNPNKTGSSHHNASLVAGTLDLLAALAARDPKTILEHLRWDTEAFSRILREHRTRKDKKGKGKNKFKSYHLDSRSRAALLSLIISMLSQDVPARIKSAFLAPGTPTLSLLQSILSGISDTYDEERYTYSYTQIKDLFETLYAGVWCDKRVTKSVKLSIFAFGQGHKAALQNVKRGGQVTGEKVWKGLLALYARAEHESSNPDITEEREAQQIPDDEGGVPADLVHHFLLALCTRPGQGLCFRDQGWYPPNHHKTSLEDDRDYDDGATTSSNNPPSLLSADEAMQRNSKYTIHNPLLLRVLRLLAPTADPRQQELAARILEACPELVPLCSDLISGGPGALDPKLNARWMICMAWYGRVVGLPVPEETFYLPSTGSTNTTPMPRLNPPPVRSVVESILPSFTGGGTKSLLTKALGTGSGTDYRAAEEFTDRNTGSGLGLVQHTTALTLCRCLRKLAQVQTAFIRAAHSAGEVEKDVEAGDSNYRDLQGTTGPWTRRLTEITREVRARLPDIQFMLAFLKRIEAAALPHAEPLLTSPTTRITNPNALVLLSESAHRLIWLYHVCFLSAPNMSAAEGLGKFDVGGLMANLSIFSAERDQHDEILKKNSAAGEFHGLKVLKDVHVLRTLRLGEEFASRVFGKVGNLRQSPLYLLLRAFARGSVASRDDRKTGHDALHDEIRGLLEQALSRSVLFRRNEAMDDRYRGGAKEEVRVWLAALADTRDYHEADISVIFLEECAQRYARTPERYLDELEEICDANMSDITRWAEETISSGLPSPLLMTVLEQLGHRIHAVSIQEQQHSPNSESAILSLRTLLSFMKGLFVRLLALCEPRALPVLRALAEKIITGKSFDDTTENEAIRIARTEIVHLQMLLALEHSSAKQHRADESMDLDTGRHEKRKQDFATLFAEPRSVTFLADPVWRSRFVGKIIVGFGDAGTHNSSERVSTGILHAVRLISHRLTGLKDSRKDTGFCTRSLILLLAELMAKLCQFELSLPLKRFVKEYVFRKNEVFHEFWISEESQGVYEEIDRFLSNCELGINQAADYALLADITEHWASDLRMQLQSSTLGTDLKKTKTDYALALLWLRYAHPRVLYNLFDLASSCRSRPETSATATILTSTILEALGRHTRTTEVEIYSDVEPFAMETELRCRLPVFLALLAEKDQNSPDLAVLEELILYALQSQLPVGLDGIFMDLLAEPSIHFRRRYHWNQRLGNIHNMLDSHVLMQQYLGHNDALTWSSTTMKVVRSAIYSGCIEPATFSSWLIRLRRAPSDDTLHMAEHLIPVLHAHLDCVRASGALSQLNENQREEFWEAYGAQFSFLVSLTSHAPPTLSAKTKMMCGICVVILLDLSVDHPPNHGRGLSRLLMKQIQTLSRDEMSLELLAIGKKCISSSDQGFNDVGEYVIDHALQWTVRMLTGCHEIDANDTRLVSETIAVLAMKTTIRPHLAEPVLTAIVREHPYSEIALRLLDMMLPKADLKPLVINRHIQILVQHPHFGRPLSHSINCALINVLYTLFHLHPFNACQPSHVQPLIGLYRGSASVADRKLLAIFRLFEDQRRISIASLLTRWTPSPDGLQPRSAFEALRDVDSLLVLRTALHFPQWRRLNNDANWDEWPECGEIYDPAFLLLLFAHVLVEDAPRTTSTWVELFRTNIVSLVIRALSAKDDPLRELAAAQIAVLWKSLEHAEILEKPYVLHILGLLRDALHPAHGITPVRFPSYTTLLLAHALRGIFYPSNFVYPITARFLLQRPTLDIGDVPMLYGMLYSNAEDHGRKDHVWIIRMLADGMQSSVDWRVFRSRHTWDLLASVFQSEEKERALRRGVLEVLANLTCIPEAAMSLLLKSNILSWIEMQLLTVQENEGLAWLKILENILVVSNHEKMESSTSGEWRACIVRCLLLLLDANKTLRTFPSLRLITGILLRLALLSGSLPSQMPRLLTRCVSVIKDQEINWKFPVTSTSMLSSRPLFEAPYSAFRLHEVPPFSESALCEAQGESIEQLWRVAMLVDVESKLSAWDELSSLLLIWRTCKGEQSIVGEWSRRQAIKNMFL